jgi:hypothetical protein
MRQPACRPGDAPSPAVQDFATQQAVEQFVSVNAMTV